MGAWGVSRLMPPEVLEGKFVFMYLSFFPLLAPLHLHRELCLATQRGFLDL